MDLPHYTDLPDNSVVCLMSPTASGKTDLAFKLYDTGRFELISVDSALIYKGMDIGTAKPTKDELRAYPHHLVDILTPTQSYSVANFVQDVERLIGEIRARNKIPVLVGGTMMYYMALLDGISTVPQTKPTIRNQVKAWHDEKGNESLYEYLKQHDPIICQKLKVTDTQRITRAVEVHMQTGKPLSEWQSTPKVAVSDHPKWHWYAIIVTPDRAWLHERIEQRLEKMWADGFLQEVIGLIEHHPDLTADIPALRAVGYRQALDYLIAINHPCVTTHPGLKTYYDAQTSNKKQEIGSIHQDFNKKFKKTMTNAGDLACQDMKNKALYATRQLAKRQYTWLKQLAQTDNPTKNNLTIVSFNSIKQVEQQLLQ